MRDGLRNLQSPVQNEMMRQGLTLNAVAAEHQAGRRTFQLGALHLPTARSRSQRHSSGSEPGGPKPPGVALEQRAGLGAGCSGHVRDGERGRVGRPSPPILRESPEAQQLRVCRTDRNRGGLLRPGLDLGHRPPLLPKASRPSSPPPTSPFIKKATVQPKP